MTETTATRRSPLAAAGAFLAEWWQQIAITQAGIYLVASFGQGHNILPPAAAWALAIGMEGTYLKGLIDAGHVRGAAQRWAVALIAGTYATVICWGIAYILSLPSVAVIPERELGESWGIFIAVIHVIPIAFTGLCSAMLHRARAEQESIARSRAEEHERERAEQLQAQLDEEARLEREERRRIALEAERKRAELAVWTEAQTVKAQLRANSANSGAENASGTAIYSPANTPANSADNVLREQIVRTLAADPKTNRSQLARDLGVGRTKLYALIREAQDRGELPREA